MELNVDKSKVVCKRMVLWLLRFYNNASLPGEVKVRLPTTLFICTIIYDKKSKYQNMDERKKARIMHVSSKNSKTLIELDDIVNIAELASA